MEYHFSMLACRVPLTYREETDAYHVSDFQRTPIQYGWVVAWWRLSLTIWQFVHQKAGERHFGVVFHLQNSLHLELLLNCWTAAADYSRMMYVDEEGDHKVQPQHDEHPTTARVARRSGPQPREHLTAKVLQNWNAYLAYDLYLLLTCERAAARDEGCAGRKELLLHNLKIIKQKGRLRFSTN